MPSRILRINVQLEAMKKILIIRNLGSLVHISTILISSKSNEKKKESYGSKAIFLGSIKPTVVTHVYYIIEFSQTRGGSKVRQLRRLPIAPNDIRLP